MPPRIFLFFLLITLVRAEPSVIDSLTIQLPSLPDDGEPPIPPSVKDSTSTSTSTTTTTTTTTTSSLPSVLSSQTSPLIDYSGHSSKNPSCPGIICFTMTRLNGSTIFDCTTELPRDSTVAYLLDCNYWQPPSTSLIPITAKFFNNGPRSVLNAANHAVPLRVVLKPRTANPNLRIAADAMVPGALSRLVEAVRQHVKPQSTTPIKLSLIMVKIKRMTYEDLASVFMVANISGLILWNPDHLEETSFLQDANKVSAFPETYVRLTFYCETENDFPAFGRLWLPWLRWQLKFLQCRGHYTCYRWPREERLCCNPKRCPETPGYVVTHADKLAKRDPAASLVHQQQVLDFYSCETESDLTNPLVELKKRENCWAIPGYGVLDTTLRPTESTSTTTTTSTTQIPPTVTTESADLLKSTAPPSTTNMTVPLQPALKQAIAEESSTDQIRMRNLVIGIICLLLLNLITFSSFVVACCWAWRKLSAQQKSTEVTGSYTASGTYEKQDLGYPYFDDDFWWQRVYNYASSEMAPTPLFARSAIQSSYEHTPVMGSRDALLPTSCTPVSVRNANGQPPSGQKSIKVTRVNQSSLRGHPHTIIIEGDVNGDAPSPSHIFPQPHYV
ncbi:hypothetical protein ECG_08252 [Echinococcus granulosus]|nr:hypothetical protein ECG_08252 [Echinococcus granulosus]